MKAAQPPQEQHTDLNERQRAKMSLFLALVLFGMAALFFFGGEGGVFTYVAALPALFGFLLTYNACHALLASKTPPTTILMASAHLIRGEKTDLTIRQYGPVRLESLRVNLLCEKSVRKNKSRDVTSPYQIEIYDSGPCEVALLDSADFQTGISVPEDAEPTTDNYDIRVFWRLEIWGKVIGRADFMRPFTVIVK